MKGPKAILSSAIANALGEYFVVDANAVESNLLRDAKIVLRKVRLREQVSRVPVNSAGNSTRITLNGCVEEVAFTWSWSVGDVVWVTDAVLTIVGAKFEARLEHADRDDDGNGGSLPVAVEEEAKDRRESFVNPSTIDRDSARQIKEQKGGLAGFVERQVKMVMDMLTLKLVDFELRVVLPQAPPAKQAGDKEVGVSSSSVCSKVLAVGGEKIELLSFGRGGQGDGAAAESTQNKLKQKISLVSFVCGISLEDDYGKQLISYPLLEPFSYSADVTRLGERFGGFMTGLEVVGLGQPVESCPDLSSMDGSGLTVHVGQVHIDTIMQLGVLMLAPPDDSSADAKVDSERVSGDKASDGDKSQTAALDDTSSFSLGLSSASLVLFEDMRLVVSGISVLYKADGTVCRAEAQEMSFDSASSGSAAATRIVLSMRPAVRLTIGCISSLNMAGILLVSPLEASEFTYEGSTLSLRFDTMIDIVTFSKQEISETKSPTIAAPALPCNINLFAQRGMKIKKSEDGSLMKLGVFHLYALKEQDCVKCAIQLELFKNHLVDCQTVSFCGSIPLTQVDTINDFIFTAGLVQLESGHSTDEYADAFRAPRKQRLPAEKKPTQPASPIKLPFASIADIKLVIGSSHKVGKIKDTTIVIKAFKGRADTTQRDLINYYAKACLSRVPDFISNAEVLGLNIVDSTAGLWATWAGAGLGLGSTFGAGAGVVAIPALDAIKGAVDAGKRSRNVSEQDQYKPGDFFRGLVQAAGEATREGAARRGKQEGGNIVDWTVGATSNATDYVVENKNRLGAAGAGGGGFLLGMALGGPIGAIVGGLAATAATGKTLETLDERGRQTKLIEGYTEKVERKGATKK